jgi:very-short-patch-repair endonuclease
MAALAQSQHGVATRAQLLELGFRPGAIRRRLEARRLRVVHRGVYAVGPVELTRPGRWMAAVLSCGEGAFLSHRSAAVLWGLMGRESTVVDVTAVHGRGGRIDVAFHECQFIDEDVTVQDSIPVATPTRTVFDLAETIDGRALRSACEEADRLGLLVIKELEGIVERGWGRHALKPIRPLIREARQPDASRSALEDLFLNLCREQRFPPPATNVEVEGYEVDAAWPKRRLLVELDGFAFHHHREAFERDRIRDAALLLAGYRVIRITHRRLTREPLAVAAQVRALLGRS